MFVWACGFRYRLQKIFDISESFTKLFLYVHRYIWRVQSWSGNMMFIRFLREFKATQSITSLNSWAIELYLNCERNEGDTSRDAIAKHSVMSGDAWLQPSIGEWKGNLYYQLSGNILFIGLEHIWGTRANSLSAYLVFFHTSPQVVYSFFFF